MKNVITVMGLVLSLAASGLSQASEVEDLGLSKIKDTRSGVAYLATDKDLSHYDKIVIADIVTDEVKVNQPSGSIVRKSNWKMDEERAARVQAMHRKAFNHEFADARGLELTDQVDENTLVLVTRLAEASPAAGYDPQQMAGRVNVYSEGSGSAVVEMFLVDGKSGEVIAAVASGRQLGHFVRNNNSVTNGSDVQMAFNIWAKQAREAVENLPELAARAN
jgi:hypothetical protein